MPLLALLRSGHWPSLLGAWLHLTVSFMVWLLVGALSLPLAVDLDLTDQQLAWLIALPLLGGAVLRVVAGWSADWIGPRPTALALLIMELVVLLWGWLGVANYGEALVWAAGLGIAGASFAVALPLAGRAYPPAAQGLVLGVAASGNVGTVFVLFLAPRWAAVLSWHEISAVMAALVMLTLLAVAWLVPHEAWPAAGDSVEWWHSAVRLIRRRAAYWLCFLYGVTFGGFVGLCSLLPLMLHEIHQLEAVAAGALAAFCGLVGSLVRPLGGYTADRLGGLRTLRYVLPVLSGAIVAITSPSFAISMALLVVAIGAMGFGNGVVFQLVAEWFPKDVGLVSGVVGAAGGVGGFLLPLLVGTLKSLTGSFDLGLWLFAGVSLCAWITVLAASRSRSAVSS